MWRDDLIGDVGRWEGPRCWSQVAKAFSGILSTLLKIN